MKNIITTHLHYFRGWKYNNELNIANNHFDISEIKQSIAVAFFIILSTSLLLNSVQSSINAKNHLHSNSNFIYQLENKNFTNHQTNNIFNNLLNIKTANAASITPYEATPLKQTHFLTIEPNKTNTITLEIKNTGEKTWEKSKTSLETGPFLRTPSNFKHSSWQTPFRVSTLASDIKPGQTASFTISLTNNYTEGEYQENFQLVYNNFPITNSLVRLFVTVKTPTITPSTITNNNLPTTTAITTTNTIAIVSTIIQDIPITTTNTVVITKNTPITNKIVTKTSTPKNSDNKVVCVSSVTNSNSSDNNPCQTNSIEEDSTNGTIQTNIKFTSEPIIRIGLFDTENAQRVTSNINYNVYAGNLLILSNLNPNYVSTLSFNKETKEYAVSTNSTTKFSIFPIRFVPSNPNGVITLIDFNKRPNWNTNLNDNKFRNIIEFNYSNTTKKLWVINELKMSDYLKGLSETSNYSPVEYQKVIATAARSYAIYHYNRGVEIGNLQASTKHTAENFHLDAIWDQVYRGYNSEIRLTKLQEAVNQTKGLVVTYNNNIVVTPYFSQSDGRTRAWEEVWYGDPKPWLKSVSVPQEVNKDMWGHGVGLSARGALYMTRDENVNWQDTLKYYYQNTDIQKIY